MNSDVLGVALPADAPLVRGTQGSGTGGASGTTAPDGSIGTSAGSPAPLLDSGEAGRLRTRWKEIQGKFVDEPRSAVQQADALVSEVIEQINRTFADELGALESQWKEGSDVSTEDLRRALQRYRSFFNRLVV
jgi:hypothetical protein